MIATLASVNGVSSIGVHAGHEDAVVFELCIRPLFAFVDASLSTDQSQSTMLAGNQIFTSCLGIDAEDERLAVFTPLTAKQFVGVGFDQSLRDWTIADIEMLDDLLCQ